ncbi:helix-turn-helix domain-containing protein [Microbacterium gilvum]|uniref:4Fe-4S Wbl-type domain-containing protein n=1 Tax=Microbacterium gilvum TaxID=1336204 RepID=A0ABP8ZPT4_9MICO
MSGIDLLEDSYPHGTLAGARECRSGVCPAPMKCRDVAIRYAGDWGFKKAVDDGEEPADFLSREEAARAAVEARDKAAKPGVGYGERRPLLARLHAQGLNDIEIALQMEITRSSAGELRRKMGLAPNPIPRKQKPREVLHGTTGAYRNGCRCEDCTAAHTTYGRERRARPAGPTPRQQRAEWMRAEVTRLNGEGLIDKEVAKRLGMSLTYVNRLRRDLGLPSRKVGKKPTTHGTASAYRHGCRCEPCLDAVREYNREYAARQRSAAVVPVDAAPSADAEHGTPERYTQGCRKRSACPAKPTCTDAALAAARERRAAA